MWKWLSQTMHAAVDEYVIIKAELPELKDLIHPKAGFGLFDIVDKSVLSKVRHSCSRKLSIGSRVGMECESARFYFNPTYKWACVHHDRTVTGIQATPPNIT